MCSFFLQREKKIKWSNFVSLHLTSSPRIGKAEISIFYLSKAVNKWSFWIYHHFDRNYTDSRQCNMQMKVEKIIHENVRYDVAFYCLNFFVYVVFFFLVAWSWWILSHSSTNYSLIDFFSSSAFINHPSPLILASLRHHQHRKFLICPIIDILHT